tara:strand:- start:28 stop:765 length:738 start_codon:yes stop_codon:yes gene_type:complete
MSGETPLVWSLYQLEQKIRRDIHIQREREGEKHTNNNNNNSNNNNKISNGERERERERERIGVVILRRMMIRILREVYLLYRHASGEYTSTSTSTSTHQAEQEKEEAKRETGVHILSLYLLSFFKEAERERGISILGLEAYVSGANNDSSIERERERDGEIELYELLHTRAQALLHKTNLISYPNPTTNPNTNPNINSTLHLLMKFLYENRQLLCWEFLRYIPLSLSLSLSLFLSLSIYIYCFYL